MSSPVRRELEDFLAGRARPERVVIAVSIAYYRQAGDGSREALRPLIDVIDRASPGIVELGSVQGGAGFEVRLAERPFPQAYEADLRRAAHVALQDLGRAPERGGGVLGRLVGALRRLFSA